MYSSSLSLFSLPAEVRCNIYSHLFEDVWLYISPSSGTTRTSQPRRNPSNPQCLPPLLNTCKQIQNEASPFFYSNLTVYFDINKTAGPAFLATWLNDIGAANARLIRHFEMRWHNYADISLDLRCKPETLQRRLTDIQVEKVRTFAYNKRIATATMMATGGKLPIVNNNQHPHPRMPLINLSVEGNPTANTQVGAKHSLRIQGVPLSTHLHPSEYWQVNGTADFCETLATNLQSLLLRGGVLGADGGFEKGEDLIDVVKFVDEHAGAMRWLWYW